MCTDRQTEITKPVLSFRNVVCVRLTPNNGMRIKVEVKVLPVEATKALRVGRGILTYSMEQSPS